MRRRCRRGPRAEPPPRIALATTLATTLAIIGGTVAACGGPAADPSARESLRTPGPTPSRTASPAASPAPTPARTSPPATPPESPHGSPHDRPDPRWRFYTDDRAWHTSPWFEGSHRVMIGYGCNASPWYSHDPRCPGRQGFHHGIDVAMPCGTPLLSAVEGEVLDPSAAGAPGSAYGVHPFRIRSGDRDILVGHTVTVFVEPGQRVHPGQRIALAGDSGAPDGCHLHFEVRRAGGGLSTAVDPAPLLALAGG